MAKGNYPISYPIKETKKCPEMQERVLLTEFMGIIIHGSKCNKKVK